MSWLVSTSKLSRPAIVSQGFKSAFDTIALLAGSRRVRQADALGLRVFGTDWSERCQAWYLAASCPEAKTAVPRTSLHSHSSCPHPRPSSAAPGAVLWSGWVCLRRSCRRQAERSPQRTSAGSAKPGFSGCCSASAPLVAAEGTHCFPCPPAGRQRWDGAGARAAHGARPGCGRRGRGRRGGHACVSESPWMRSCL